MSRASRRQRTGDPTRSPGSASSGGETNVDLATKMRMVAGEATAASEERTMWNLTDVRRPIVDLRIAASLWSTGNHAVHDQA